MENTTVSSLLLGLIADCAKAVPKLGINHIQLADGLLKASNFHNEIYVNIDIASLDTDNEKRLDLSIQASARNISLLRSVGKTGVPKEKDISVTMSDNIYSFVDKHRKTEIRKIDVRKTTTTISDFILKGNLLGTTITSTGKAELSLKGNESCVLLGVYGGQLASIIAPGPEHFFEADTSRQMIRKDLSIFKSYGFLKFGSPDFNLSLYMIEDEIWLLTKGIFADDLPFTVLEKMRKNRGV